MKEIFLSQEIDNDNGYIDSVVSEIKAITSGEPLNMLITCVGGDIFQGDRINRAVLEHDGATKATVIGLAASMAGVLLSAFDEVELDSDCEIMLHKAHIPNMELEELTNEQRQGIERFNRRAYSRLESMGMDSDILNEIFLTKEVKDVWLTAKEAESVGLGKVVKIERKDSKPFKIAATLDLQQIKNKYLNMGLFNKNKKVTRVATLKDGRQVTFLSETEAPEKGSILNLVGSNDSLKGKVNFQNNLVAEVDEEGKVVDLEEGVANEVSDEEKAEMMERLSTLEKTMAELLEKLSEQPEEEAPEAMEEKEKEIADKIEKLEDSQKAMADLLKNTLEVAQNIKGSFTPPKVENKHEGIMDGLAHLSASEKRAIELRNVLEDTKK